MEYAASKPNRSKRTTGTIIACGCALTIAVAGLVFWGKHQKTASLLPKQIADQAQFTPYFYFDTIPAGYTIGTTQTDGGVIMVSLVKKDSPTIVLTEQSLPEKLDVSSLQRNEDKIKGTEAPATINKVGERLVGTMIDKKNSVLVLLSVPGDTSKNDLSTMLKNLRLIR
jgi:hypothetical protein